MDEVGLLLALVAPGWDLVGPEHSAQERAPGERLSGGLALDQPSTTEYTGAAQLDPEEVHGGSRRLTVPVPLHQIPLYLREGGNLDLPAASE
jgi:hypothetical protein